MLSGIIAAIVINYTLCPDKALIRVLVRKRQITDGGGPES
jgi:hypothetical protein